MSPASVPWVRGLAAVMTNVYGVYRIAVTRMPGATLLVLACALIIGLLAYSLMRVCLL